MGVYVSRYKSSEGVGSSALLQQSNNSYSGLFPNNADNSSKFSNLQTKTITQTSEPKYLFRTAKQSFETKAVKSVVKTIFANRVKDIFNTRTDYCAKLLKNFPQRGLEPGCMNQIRNTNLMECSCQLFDRVNFPTVRRYYEDATIEKIMTKIRSQINEKGFFDLTICIYSPGKLASEAVLMTRLLKTILDAGYANKGKITLSVVDDEYAGLTSNNFTSFSESQKDFLSLLAVLQKETGIEINTYLYESDADYITSCQKNPELRNDLFIGSDLGKNASFCGQVFEKTRKARSEISLLSSKEEKPFYSDGAKEIDLSQLEDKDKDFSWKPILCVVLVLAVMMGLGYLYKSKKK